MLKKLDIDAAAPWKQRFRVARVPWSCLAAANPERGLVLCNRDSSAFELYAWDVPTGQLRQLTNRPGGTPEGWISADGRFAYYLEDQQGSELGHLVRVPFAGGEPKDLTPDLPAYTLRGLDLSRAGNLLAFNPVNADGFALYAIDLEAAGKPGTPRLLYQSKQEAWEAILSHGGEIAVMKSTHRAGGLRRYCLLAFDTSSGAQVGELWDGPENSVEPIMFSPQAGDFRLLATTTRSGYKRPLLWNPRTGERTDLELGALEGDVIPPDWSGQSGQILLGHFRQACQQLYRYDPASGTLTRLDHPSGSWGDWDFDIFGRPPYYGPAGEIFAHWQDATHPYQLVALDGRTGTKKRTVLAAGEVPAGHPWKSVTFTSSDGQEVQGWLGLPEGSGPFPTILEMHGGPHAVVTETFDRFSQAWLDHGFAYLTINFRGSTSFGQKFQGKIWGDIGHWELEDIVAARNWLVVQGIARPEAILLSGASYGGYLTLWGMGRRPDLWAGGMAEMAIADWTGAYEDASDALKGAMRAWFAGSPTEKPERYVASSPITYAENVRAPVLIIQGRNDTRTPARQVELYETRMRALGKDIAVEWFDSGHSANEANLDIQAQEHKLRFAYRVLEGIL